MANWKKTFELFLETKLSIFNIQILLINKLIKEEFLKKKEM